MADTYVTTGTNTEYSTKMPAIGNTADIQMALKAYHYGDPALSTTALSASFGSDFANPDTGMVSKLKYLKTEITNLGTNKINTSLVTTKGDLVTATASSTPARLGVGTDGYILKANSLVSTGLEWYDPNTTHLSLAGGTLSGNLNISKAAGVLKGIYFQSSAGNRWGIYSNSTAESSTATGSDLVIERFNNSASTLGNAVTITRSSGDVTLSGALSLSTSISTGSTTFSLVNTTATTVNFAGAATTLNIGASGGTITIGGNLNVASVADTATAATHYYVETATDGLVRPKTLANVKTEIVTTAAVNSAAATTVGTITSGTWHGSVISATYIDSAIARLAGPTFTGTVSLSATTSLASVGDTATAASHYYVETATDGLIRPKTLANVKTEIVTSAAVNSALTGRVRYERVSSTLALNNSGTNSGITDLVFGTVVSDPDSCYNSSTGVYTVPATGYYAFSAYVLTTFVDGINYLQLVNTTVGANQGIEFAETVLGYFAQLSCVTYATAGDTIKLQWGTTSSASGKVMNTGSHLTVARLH